MTLSDFPPFDAISKVLRVATSGQRIKQALITPLYVNALYLMLSTFVTSLFGFFFWLIVARLYVEYVVGYSAAIISALNLLAILSLVGFNTSLVRFLPQSEKPGEMINTCFTLSGLVSVLAAGIFLSGLSLWSPALSFINENVAFYTAFLLFTALWTLYTLVSSVFLSKRRAGFNLYKSTIFSLLKLPLPVLFACYFQSFGVVASWGIALAAALAVAIFLFLPRVQNGYRPMLNLDLSLVKKLWRYSTGNYLVNLLIAAMSLLLPLIVVNILGAEQNAYFYIPWMMAGLLFAIPGATSSSLFAEGSNSKDQLSENVVRSLKSTFLLVVPAATLLAVAGKWLLLAFGKSYSANSLGLLWVLCLSALPQGVTGIYATVLRLKGGIRELVVINGFTAVTVLLGSYLFLPSIGINGIGYIWLGAHLIVTIYILAGRKLTH